MTARLPVVGSTAATTAFCSARIDGPDGSFLWVDGNGKITASNGTLKDPKPNAFSLPAAAVSGMEHCPGSTPTCRKACYVGPLEKAQRATYDLYEHNAVEIRRILADEDLANEWVMIFADWIKRNASGGFRWHVSGDLFSIEYAMWIADVCRESAPVMSWIYTRTFDRPILDQLYIVSTTADRGPRNLAINLSCDKDNLTEAQLAALEYSTIYNDLDEHGAIIDGERRFRLCYLTTDGELPRFPPAISQLDHDDVIFPDYTLRPRQFATLAESPWWQSLSQYERGLVCPVDAHGKSEGRRCGPCSRCMS